MDIKPPISINPTPQLAASSLVSGLPLQLDQLLQAKVIETQLILNQLTLQIGDKAWPLRTNSPVPVTPGQVLQLQVSKLLPQLEFKLAGASDNPDIRLTLIAKSPTSLPAPNSPAIQTFAADSPATTPTLPPRILATVVNLTPNKLVLLTASPVPVPVPPPHAEQDLPAESSPLLPAAPSNNPATAADKPRLLAINFNQLWQINAETSEQSPAEPSSSLANKFISPVSTDRLQALSLKQLSNWLPQPGMKIELQPLQTPTGPAFAIVTARPLPVSDRTELTELRKQLLPLQLPQPVLIQHLQQLTLPSSQIDISVAERLQHLAVAILRDLPGKPQLTDAHTLRDSVDNSGLFLEAKLLKLLKAAADNQDLPTLRQDLKFKLNQFAESILKLIEQEQPNRPLQPETLQLLESSLSKLHGALAKQALEQFTSLPREDGTRQCWVVELPFHNPPQIDHLKLEIEQDLGDKDSESKPNTWAVSITISPPDLGTIHCKVSCYDGTINTRFWSESVATVEKLNRNMDHLKQQFEQKGLVAGFMEAHPGKPAASDNQRQPPASLLSIKA